MIRCKVCHLASCTCGKEDWEDYQTGGEAKAENQVLRERIKQLEAHNAELLKHIDRIYESGQSGIAHVGCANYAEREREARNNLRDVYLQALASVKEKK